MKACGDPDCLAAFFDASKNHTGRWCARRCGNRCNARAMRRRGGPRPMEERMRDALQAHGVDNDDLYF